MSSGSYKRYSRDNFHDREARQIFGVHGGCDVLQRPAVLVDISHNLNVSHRDFSRRSYTRSSRRSRRRSSSGSRHGRSSSR